MRGKGLLCVLLVAIVLVAVVHLFFCVLITIQGEGMEPTFLHGDRVIVNRWSYGLRSPFVSFTGYRRYLPRPISHDEWIAFNTPDTIPSSRPDTGQVCIGRCLALPGDTVWMGRHGKVSLYRDYATGNIWPVIVPTKGADIKIHPWNAHLYAISIRRYEGVNVTLQGDSLYFNGERIEHYRFHNDFYWMESGNDMNLNDSRAMGFIPESNVIGCLKLILYSLDGLKPRLYRTFKSNL